MTINITRLDNGLRVVTEHMTGVSSASLGLWVEAGSRSEKEQENGVAHFLEHMAFKGTSKRSAQQISSEIESVGGYLNAYTSRERTAYYARVLSEHVPLAIDIISDIIVNSVYDDRDIEVERGVIIQEINQSADVPDNIIFDWAQECAFPSTSLGRPILGSIETVTSFSKDDFLKFISNHYSSDDMVFSAAGDVDHAKVVDLARKAFEGLKVRTRPKEENIAYVGGELHKVKELEQAHVVLGFPGLSYCDDDRYVNRVYTTILGGGMASRLFQNVREKLGLCYSIYASSLSYRDTGKLYVYAGTSGDQLSQLLEVVSKEIKELAKSVDQCEIERAKNQLKAMLLMRLESVPSRCERLSSHLMSFGRIYSIQEIRDEIDAVTRDRVVAYATGLLSSGKPTLVTYSSEVGDIDLGAIQSFLAA
jgi:predicted Zn-dependent peptidase